MEKTCKKVVFFRRFLGVFDPFLTHFGPLFDPFLDHFWGRLYEDMRENRLKRGVRKCVILGVPTLGGCPKTQDVQKSGF